MVKNYLSLFNNNPAGNIIVPLTLKHSLKKRVMKYLLVFGMLMTLASCGENKTREEETTTPLYDSANQIVPDTVLHPDTVNHDSTILPRQ
jgi:hypothetical protein